VSALEFRPARLTDLDTVAALATLQSGRDRAHTRTKTRELLLQQDPPTLIAVAAGPSGILGFGQAGWLPCMDATDARCVPAGWYLLGVVVDPAARRRQIGARLTTYRLDWLRQQAPGGTVRYFRAHDNIASARLHAPYGFALERPDVWAPGLEYPQPRHVLERASL
jgi:aminoglycoside 6'-N-acetyltransferase I